MRIALTAVTAGLLAAVLAGCGGGSAAVQNSQNVVDGGTFTLVLATDPGNLDPHITTMSAAIQTNRFLYDSLVDIDQNSGLVAGLASKWEGDSGRATYTLRKGVTCSDGTPLTATTVADNINFVADPANAAGMTGIDVPAGAKAVADEVAGTVTVTSANPDSFLVRNVGQLPIVCAKGMKNRDLLKQGADGTGLYTVSEAVSGDHYTFKRRKDYAWGPGSWSKDTRGLPDTVVIRIVGNETTAANLLLSKEVNAAGVLGPDQQRLRSTPMLERDQSAPLGELWFNQRSGQTTADEAVRRALTQALDLNQLGQVLTSGTGKPTTSLVAPGLGPCNQNTIGSLLPAHDAAAAGTALDNAGWTRGADGVRAKNGKKLALTFHYPSALGATVQSMAELVQQMWTAIGVHVDVKAMGDAESTQILSGQAPWDAMLLPLTVTLPTQLVPFLSGPAAPQGNNFAAVDNPEYNAAVQAASAVAGADGCAKWGDGDKAVVKHLNVVPFVNALRPLFAQGVKFETSEGDIEPSSLRMLG